MTVFAILLAITAQAETTAAEIGAPAPDFTLTDLDGKTVSLADYKGKTVVLEWFNPGCPYVEYAHGEKGPLKTMAAEQADNIVWLAINSGAEGKQGHGLETNKEAAATWSLSHPILLDEDGKVGKLYGAKTTPQMYVVNDEGTLVYGYGLDNAPFGKTEGKTVPFLVKALDDLAAEREVATNSTKPYGCSVKY